MMDAFDQLMAGKAPVMGSAQTQEDISQTKEANQAVTSEPAAYLEPSQLVTPAQAYFTKPTEAAGKHAEDVYGQASNDVAESMAMFGVIHGSDTYESVVSKFEKSKLAVERAQRLSAYRNVSPAVQDILGQGVQDFALSAAPGVIATTEAGLIGAGPGAVAGATFGGIGAVPGAYEGFSIGSATMGAMMGAGDAYKEMRKRGLTHKQAVPWAIAAGTLEGSIMHFRVKGLVPGLAQAYNAAIERNTFMPALVQYVARFLHTVGVNASLAASQSVAGSLMQYGAAIANQGKLPDLGEQTLKAVDAAKNGAVLGAAFHVIGSVFGEIVKAISKKTEGEVIPIGTSIDTAASQAHVYSLWVQATDLEGVYKGVNNTVDKLIQEGKPVPPALLQASYDALDALHAAQTKAKAAAEAHQAKIAFDALSDDERKKAVMKELDQAEGALLHVQHKIDSLIDPNKPTPELKAELKQARINKRIAVENKRQVELETERKKLEEKATSNEATPAAIAAAKAISKIDAELKQIKLAAVKRQSVKRITELQADIDNVESEIAERDKAVQDETKKAVDKINVQRKAFSRPLLKAIEKMDMETEIRKKHPTAKLKERLAKLKDQLDYLKLLVDLIDSDSLTPDEIKSLNVKIHSGSVEALVNTARRLITRVARDTSKNVTRDIKNDFKLVESFVRHSGLSEDERAKLKQFQPGGNLAEHMDYLEGRIKDLVDKRETKEANEALDKALERTQPQLVNKTLRGLPAVQAVLTTYRELIADLRDESKSDKMLTAIFTKEISNDDVLAEPEPGAVHPVTVRAIAEEILDALGDTGSPEKITALAEHIEAIAQKGLGAKTEALQEFAAKMRDNAQTLLHGMPKKGDTSFENESFVERTKRFSADLIMAPWNILVETITQGASKEAKAKALKLLDVRKTVDAERAGINEATDRLFDLVVGKDKKLQAVLIEGSISKKRPNAPHADLKNISDNKLMQLYAWMLDPSLAPRLVKGNGFTLKGENSTRAWVESELSPTQIEMVNKVVEFYREMYAEANEAHIRRFHFPLKDNPHYGGMAMAILEDTTNNDFLKALTSHSPVAPGFLKKRIENIAPLPLNVDIIDNARGYIRMLKHFAEWTREGDNGELSAGDRLQALANPEVQKRIEHLYGEKALNMINVARLDITGIKPIVIKKIPFIGELVKSVGNVIHSPIQLWKQSTGSLMYLKYENAADLFRGAGEVLINYEKYSALFAKMDFLKARENTKHHVLEARIQNVKAEFFGLRFGKHADNVVAAGLRVFQQIQSLPLMVADVANIHFGGGALYVLAHERAIKADASEAEAHAQAEAYMAKASVETQGSSLIDQRTSLERDAFGAMLSQFSKPAVQAHFAAAADVRNLLAKPSLENFHKALASSFAVRAAETAFVAAGAVAPLLSALLLAQNGDEKKLDDAIHDFLISEFLASTFGPATGLPNLSNQMLNMIYKSALNAATHGKAHEYETQIPVLEMATSGVVFAYQTALVASGDKELSREELFTILRAGNRSILMGTTGLNEDWILGITRFALDYNETPEETKARKAEDRVNHEQKVKDRL